MKIQYENIKKRLRNSLILAFIWLIWGVASFYIYSSTTPAYGFLSCAFAYFALFWYQLRYPYLTIENGLIYKNTLWSSKIELSKIKNIDKKVYSIIVVSDNSTLTIDTQLIDKESLAELKSILNIKN